MNRDDGCVQTVAETIWQSFGPTMPFRPQSRHVEVCEDIRDITAAALTAVADILAQRGPDDPSLTVEERARRAQARDLGSALGLKESSDTATGEAGTNASAGVVTVPSERGVGGRPGRRNKRWWKDYGPNSSDRFSLVSASESAQLDLRAHWPIVLTQLVGGKRWSLSLVRHTTPKPVLTEHGEQWLRAQLDAPTPAADGQGL